MKLKSLSRLLPTWQNALLATLSAVLLILAFPPFELWFTAWFALVPLLWAVDRERDVFSSFTLGWLFGSIFFLGTCWWLTFAPITYAGFPPVLAYLLLFCVTSVASIFPGMFSAIASFLLKRFGPTAFLAVPCVWVFAEFARFWLTGNNWNAIGYSQSTQLTVVTYASLGGVLLVGFFPILSSSLLCIWMLARSKYHLFVVWFMLAATVSQVEFAALTNEPRISNSASGVIALQPNVPMAGLTIEKWRDLRQRHVHLADSALARIQDRRSVTVVFPESPMNFQYDDDPETRKFINDFAARNNVSVLFNSAEPDKENNKYFNSAVLVGPEGNEIAQYDKIYLLPFGEAVPVPLESIVPAFVGSFSYGKEYDLLPIGDAKAGVMICFENHFGQLSAEYVRRGADVIIEMTNDGYLGPTPVLRQHLANAVFRAVETNRPVLRVTNVGITAYINERGEVLDAAESYVEDTRVWSVPKSDGSQTFYVKYGDWFAWLCTLATLSLLGFGMLRRKPEISEIANSE
jgi:apolipoprotein N-acyltransferase